MHVIAESIQEVGGPLRRPNEGVVVSDSINSWANEDGSSVGDQAGPLESAESVSNTQSLNKCMDPNVPSVDPSPLAIGYEIQVFTVVEARVSLKKQDKEEEKRSR